LLLFFFLLWQYWGLNSGLMLAMKCPTTLTTYLPSSPVLFALVIFQIGSWIFLLRPAWTAVLYFHISHSWDDKHVPTHPAFLLNWSLANVLPGLAFNCDPPRSAS
jgi:hypothetical protein